MNFRDIANVSLKNGLFSTELHITTRWNGDEITIPALGKENAQYIHSLIQKGIRRSGIGEELISNFPKAHRTKKAKIILCTRARQFIRYYL
jgi:hypothetical protein